MLEPKKPRQGKITLNLPSVFPMLFMISQCMNLTEYLVDYMIQLLLCFHYFVIIILQNIFCPSHPISWYLSWRFGWGLWHIFFLAWQTFFSWSKKQESLKSPVVKISISEILFWPSPHSHCMSSFSTQHCFLTILLSLKIIHPPNLSDSYPPLED